MEAPHQTSCQRCRSPLERGDLRCAICGQVVPAGGGEVREAAEVEVLRCEGCGAAASFDARSQGLSCPFCDSVMHLESIEDPMEQTQAWLPFTAEAGEARQALGRWLSGLGWFRPADLTPSARLESLRPLWWVGWAFDARARISWTADSNAGSRRSDWAPHSGQVELAFDDLLVSASRGLTDRETARLGGHYDLASARPAPEGAGEEATVEQFDVQRSQARARILAAIERVAAARVEADCVPGTRRRKVKTATLLEGLSTRRLAFPAYVLAYRYKDELYRAVVCGQDASCVEGSAPYSIARIALAVLLGLTVIAAVLLVLAVAL